MLHINYFEYRASEEAHYAILKTDGDGLLLEYYDRFQNTSLDIFLRPIYRIHSTCSQLYKMECFRFGGKSLINLFIVLSHCASELFVYVLDSQLNRGQCKSVVVTKHTYLIMNNFKIFPVEIGANFT